MKTNKIILTVIYLLSFTIHAQNGQTEIRFLDLESGMPISQATYLYGTQIGLTDKDGVLRFVFSEGEEIKLSHVNYGKWTLNAAELQTALNEQVSYKRSVTVNLYPVTVIAVKKQHQPDEELKIEYQDRLEHDAATLLNQTPAFNSIRKGGSYGFEPVFRGFKYDQLNIVMNGAQSTTAACPNRMDPPTSQMAPNMMDRIEILKGPHALRYGTGFGATINFIPAKLRFTSNSSVYGRLSTGYESNGNIAQGESQVGLSGEKYDVSLFASWSQGDDYNSGNGETIQADYTRGSFGTNVGIKLTSNQQLRLSATYNRARDADFPALPMDLREDDTWLFNARHDIKINGNHLQGWNTTLFGSFVDHLMDNLIKDLSPRMMNAKTDATTYNYGGRTEGEWVYGKNKLYTGADLRKEGADGTRVREMLIGPMMGMSIQDNAWQDGSIAKTGVFAEYQIDGENFDYVFSGRLELNSARINDPAVEFTNANEETEIVQFNPSVSLGMLKNFNNKFQTSLWLARAQRSGSLTERFINYFPVGKDPYEMLGNTKLTAEVNNQIDLAFKCNPSEKSAIQVDIFAAYLQDYISSVIDEDLTPKMGTSPGVRRYFNIDKAFKTGFEISWNQQLFASLSHNFAVAYTYGQDLVRDEALPEIAPIDLRYALYGSYLNGKLKSEASFRYVMEQSRISEEFGETITPSFSLIDVKLGYQILRDVSFNIGVNNLLDENYYEHLNRSVRGTTSRIYSPGRNIFANLNYSF